MNDKQVIVAQVIGKMMGGGVEAFVMNYYRNIDRDKVQFDFIIDDDSTKIPFNEISALGGRIYLVPSYKRIFPYMWTLIKLFKKNKYTIVHSHINTLSVFSLFSAKMAGVRVRIAHSHSTAGKGEIKKNILKYLLRPFSKLFPTHCCACSKLAGRWLFGNKFLNNNKVRLLKNAININDFLYDSELRKKIRSDLNIESNFVIGHVGRFMRQKNHSFLIDIFYEVRKLCDNAILLLIGDGELKEEMMQKVKNLEIEDYVFFLGFREDTNKLYQAMDIFLLPSNYEGLGIVSVEAQANGLVTFLSTNVPKEARITDLCKYYPLKYSASKWAGKILTYRSYLRKKTHKELADAGYSIREEATKLTNFYLKLYHDANNLDK